MHGLVTKPTLIFIFRGFVPHEEIQFLFSLIVTMMLASLASYIRFLTWRGDRNTQSWIGSENKAAPSPDSAECDYPLKVKLSAVVLGVNRFKNLHLEVDY